MEAHGLGYDDPGAPQLTAAMLPLPYSALPVSGQERLERTFLPAIVCALIGYQIRTPARPTDATLRS
jgi:hypothetical protein